MESYEKKKWLPKSSIYAGKVLKNEKRITCFSYYRKMTKYCGKSKNEGYNSLQVVIKRLFVAHNYFKCLNIMFNILKEAEGKNVVRKQCKETFLELN